MMFGPTYIRTARVTQVVSEVIYRVCLEAQGDDEQMSARSALPGPVSLKLGDQVLVAGDSPTSGFIIGVLSSSQYPSIKASNGAGAKIEGAGADQSITVHDAGGQVVFQYYPDTGKSIINAPQGDLQLAAPNGHIELAAGKQIRCQCQQDITMDASHNIRLSVKSEQQQLPQSLAIDGNGMQMGVHRLEVTAGQADINVADTVYHGRQFTSRVGRARWIFDKLEVRTRRLWERSEDVVRSVVNLCQVQAGRMRTLVKGAHHVQSERTAIIARQDVRIDGKKINLG